MRPDYQLRYGQDGLTLYKSREHFALSSPSLSASELFTNSGTVELTGLSLEPFHILRTSARNMEKSVDQWREHPRVSVGSHVYFSSEHDEVPFVPSGELHLRFSESASQESCEDILDRFSLRIARILGPRDLIAKVTHRSMNPVKCAAELQQLNELRIAEPGLITAYESCRLGPLPGDSMLEEQWHLQNTGDNGGSSFGLVAGADARVVKAWNWLRSKGNTSYLGRPEVIVAVIDDGFDLNHPEFSGKIVAPWDFTRNNALPEPKPRPRFVLEEDRHGTAVAGIAVGNADGNGIVGVAPNCGLMPIRTGSLDSLRTGDWINYAWSSGAAVINCSWKPIPARHSLSTHEVESLERCAKEGRGGRGTVVCFAAGNDDQNIRSANGSRLNGYAEHPSVITVAASTGRDRRAYYSNFGDAVTLCAPGGLGSRGIITSDLRGDYQSPIGIKWYRGYDKGDYTRDFDGTSSACPIVAGVAALMISVQPKLTGKRIKKILKKTARQIDKNNVSYDTNGHSRELGYGCVDAKKAVKEALKA